MECDWTTESPVSGHIVKGHSVKLSQHCLSLLFCNSHRGVDKLMVGARLATDDVVLELSHLTGLTL
jgi:hypothetical protein